MQNPKSNYTGMLTLLKREVSRFLRVWSQTIVPPIVTSLLFILIFGYSLGSRISNIQGISYINYIIPGLLMMGVIISAYANTSSSLFIAKFQKSIQEYLIAPLSYWQIVMALTLAGVLRALLVGVGILIISLIATPITISNAPILIYFITLTSFLFSFAGIITGLWAESFDKMNVFSVFLITPLTYLGGVFYSINMLPQFWQNIAKFNPILYMVDGFRFGFLGISDINIYFSMALLFVLTLIFFIWCLYLFKKGYKIRS
jgi:ABC-2 type transport system permease protein